MEEKPRKKRKVNFGRNNGKMGAPIIQIDWEQFDKLCEIQCTLNEIAGWFDCSEDTIERRVKERFGITFAEQRNKRSSKGKIGLRRKQMQQAMGGNTALLIWLGKQYLNQREPEEGNSAQVADGFAFIDEEKKEGNNEEQADTTQ